MLSNTSTEFVELRNLMHEEVNEREPILWYLAQIAKEVRRTINPKAFRNLKTEDLLIPFVFDQEEKKGPLTEDQKKARLQNSKNFWLALANRTKPNGNRSRTRKADRKAHRG